MNAAPMQWAAVAALQTGLPRRCAPLATRERATKRAPEQFWNKSFRERGETDGQGLRANTCSPLPDSRVSTRERGETDLNAGR